MFVEEKGDNSRERKKRRKTDLFQQTLKVMSGILFHIFAPILEKEFLIWSVLECLIMI